MRALLKGFHGQNYYKDYFSVDTFSYKINLKRNKTRIMSTQQKNVLVECNPFLPVLKPFCSILVFFVRYRFKTIVYRILSAKLCNWNARIGSKDLTELNITTSAMLVQCATNWAIKQLLRSIMSSYLSPQFKYIIFHIFDCILSNIALLALNSSGSKLYPVHNDLQLAFLWFYREIWISLHTKYQFLYSLIKLALRGFFLLKSEKELQVYTKQTLTVLKASFKFTGI